ncbi:MAG: hypothetical protein CM1200mP18_05390 [Gammaproteobacteria bacterium]|nr:MAG: hypothetical protein CM1200mP18_05390 [Gammaproteobacteria bacterium]
MCPTTDEEIGQGRIVTIASTAGLKGYPYVVGYCAAKQGRSDLLVPWLLNWEGVVSQLMRYVLGLLKHPCCEVD